MPNIISAKLALDPINGLRKRACHYCGIIDQNIDALDALIDVRSCFSDSVLAAEI